nr:sucrose nonfermenting 4-like protein isoform X2 [Ipomoea trifida]
MGSASRFGIIVFLGLQNKSGGGTSDGYTINNSIVKCNFILYTRATEGPIVADKNCMIIHYMAPNIYCCGAGTAADTEAVTVTQDMFQLLWFLKRNGSHSVYMALRRWGDGTVMNSMNGSTMALSSAIDLPPGYHQYKFLVDGTWQVDEEQLRVIGEHGVINNLIFVEEPSANAQRLPPEAVRGTLDLDSIRDAA